MSNLINDLIEENKRTQSKYLDLSNCGLTTIPDEIMSLTWLTELNLSNHFLPTKKVKVSNTDKKNRIETNSYRKLIHLTKLKNLDLSFNYIKNTQFLSELLNLQNLNIKKTGIKDYEFLSKLTQLKIINASHNQIQDTDSLLRIKHLNVIDLSYNQIEDITFLKGFDQLQSLDLSSNYIDDFSLLGTLLQIKRLNLNYNYIRNINFLHPLTDLKVLELKDNRVSDFRFISNLIKLEDIDLSYNRISDIRFLENLSQLRYLNLSNNQIVDATPVEKLNKLEHLIFKSSGISDFRFISNLIKLEDIDLSYNRISDIRFLENLSQLRYLSLSNNQIVDITPVGMLTYLHHLDLQSNQVQDIRCIRNLTQIRQLDLQYNRITSIQPLENLTQLKVINAADNNIETFPKDLLIKCKNIKEIYINGNPIKNIPKDQYEINGNAYKNLKGYIASLQQGSIMNDEVKLIVLGNTTAGKTSLVQFLRDETYDEAQYSTHGIVLNRWALTDLDNPLTVNIWDFGGQEYYHATHRLFLDDHAVYVVIWEASTNKEEIILTDIYLSGEKRQLKLEHFPYSYWLDSIRYYAPDSTIILVHNKTDKTRGQNIPDRYFNLPYNIYSPPHNISIFNASKGLKNSDNQSWASFSIFKAQLIEQLQSDAAKYDLGIGWVIIRDGIRQLSKLQYWMGIEEFDIFCQQIVAQHIPPLRFDSEVEMRGLLSYLSGAASAIVYYPDDTILKDIVFLNPEWVTDTIYEILNYNIQTNFGEFNRDHVELVLKDKGIFNLTEMFIELMKKDRFELIFEKTNNTGEYIAPQYLPSTYDKKNLEKYRRKTLLSFVLYFPRFLPRSIFLRFIVRYGNLATEIYWKYGIVLEKAGIDILAEHIFTERKIRIAIEKDPKSRVARDLFEALWQLCDKRKDIELSVNENEFINIGELIDCIADSEITKIKSKQGSWLYKKDFLCLFDKENKVEHNETQELVIPLGKNTINPMPEIFFSYAWGDENEIGESREKVVDDLYESLKNDGYNVIRDKMDLDYKGLISDFMKKIGKGNIVIVAISDKYLKSIYCMSELLEIYRNSRFEKEGFSNAIFPIRVESIALNKPTIQSSYFDYWDGLEKEWKELITKHSTRVRKSQFAEYEKVRNIHNQLGDLIEHLSDMNVSTKELISSNNFSVIKQAIQNRNLM